MHGDIYVFQDHTCRVLGERCQFFKHNHTDIAVMWFREHAVMSFSSCGMMDFHPVCAFLSVPAEYCVTWTLCFARLPWLLISVCRITSSKLLRFFL